MQIASITSPVAHDAPPNPHTEANRQLASAVRTLNDAGAAGPGREFSFSIDPQTKRSVIRIVDASTGELVEQFPSQYILNVAQELTKNSPLKTRDAADKYFVETIE